MKINSNVYKQSTNSFSGTKLQQNLNPVKTAVSGNKKVKQAAIITASAIAAATALGGLKVQAAETVTPQTIIEEYNKAKEELNIEKFSDNIQDLLDITRNSEGTEDADTSKTNELIGKSIDKFCEFDAKYGDMTTKILLLIAYIKIHFLKSNYNNVVKHFNDLNRKVNDVEEVAHGRRNLGL